MLCPRRVVSLPAWPAPPDRCRVLAPRAQTINVNEAPTLVDTQLIGLVLMAAASCAGLGQCCRGWRREGAAAAHHCLCPAVTVGGQHCSTRRSLTVPACALAAAYVVKEWLTSKGYIRRAKKTKTATRAGRSRCRCGGMRADRWLGLPAHPPTLRPLQLPPVTRPSGSGAPPGTRPSARSRAEGRALCIFDAVLWISDTSPLFLFFKAGGALAAGALKHPGLSLPFLSCSRLCYISSALAPACEDHPTAAGKSSKLA